ncbi:MAG: sulfotransferase family 2 domain-containing protein [Candidatus Paceibacterota bacterium]
MNQYKQQSTTRRTLRSLYKLSQSLLGLNAPKTYTYYEELGVIFISVFKNANTSINRMFFDKLGLPYDPDDYQSIHRYKDEHLNLTKREFLSINTENIFVFAFSRNPFTRLVSCYQNKIHDEYYWNMHENYFGIFYPKMPFVEFAEKVCMIPNWYADGHFTPQTYTIYPNGKDKVDYVGKVENFKEDIEPIINKFNLTPPPQNEHYRKKAGYRKLLH